jgi:hypothetical protein
MTMMKLKHCIIIQVGEQRRTIELLAIRHFKGKMVAKRRELYLYFPSLSKMLIPTAGSCPNFYPMWQMMLGQILHGIPSQERVYLAMDNASGHGTDGNIVRGIL